MKHVLMFALLVWLAACSGPQKATAPPASSAETKDENAYARERESDPDEDKKEELHKEGDIRRVVVSFYSQGAGSDAAAISNFLDFVANFENHNQVKINAKNALGSRGGG
jgi:hypothetical protein